MKNKLERRSVEFEVRAAEEEAGYILEGRAVVYDKPTVIHDWRGEYIEVIKSGALNNTDLKDVRLLANHDLSKIPYARSRNNNENSTMQLYVDSEGLKFRSVLDKENTESRNLWSAVKRGDVSGVSFLFASRNDKWENTTEGRKRTISDISTIIEISIVTMPAYEETSVSARNKSALDNAQSELDSSHDQVDTRSKDYAVKALLKMYS